MNKNKELLNQKHLASTTNIETKINDNVRVRFAPSPTGNLHVGGLRTALFNYLFAKKYNGKFILRIDDTDAIRSKKEYELSILNDIQWFDLRWDEFYRQSERTAVYKKYLNILKEKGLVYECFCTEEELLKSKELAIRNKKPYIYNGRCLHISDIEKDNLRKKLEGKGLPPSIRLNTLKSGMGHIVFDDLVHGNVSFNTKLLGDFILKTADSRFTYNFASIIDDIDLNISHIIRGEDHISNTPKQILLCMALEKKPPVFAHISLLYGKDGKLMSKRDLNANLDYYKNIGYLPQALLNYLAITGNTFLIPETTHQSENKNNIKTEEKEVFSNLPEMAILFDIKKAKNSGAIFNKEKLLFINEKWLKNTDSASLINIIKEKFSNLNEINDVSALKKLDTEYGFKTSLNILNFLKEEYKTIKEIMEELPVFFNGNQIVINYDKEIITILRDFIEKEPMLTEDILKNIIKEIASKYNKNIKDIYKNFRLILTGKQDGPSIIKIAALLGKDRIIKRLS